LEPEVTGGYLFKVDRADPGDTGFSAAGTTMMYVDPKEPEIERADRAAQRAYVTRFFSQFSSALNGTNYRNPTNGYARYLDVDPSIDFHILNSVAFNVDALVLSTYLYKPRDGKLTFGPVWDFDRSLGSTDGRDVNPRTWGANLFSFSWWPRLFSDPDFTQRWIDRYQAMREGPLSRSNSFARLDLLTGQLKQAQPRERAKWGTTYRGGTYATEITYSKNWLSNRLDFIDTRFVPMARAGTPVIEGGGTQIRLALIPPTNASVVVYYTTDGTDPRLSGGGISTAARLYDPLTAPAFTRNTRVIARNYSTVNRTGVPNSRWGGPLTNILVLQRPALRITEVHYHPAGEDASEFLEVFNLGAVPVSLTGWQLGGGIQFRFSGTNALERLGPGERCIVVSDRVAYGPVPPGLLVAGEFSGRLANEGDRVELRGPVGELVDGVAYDDAAEPLADGGGWSLVPRSEGALDAAIWRLSAELGGSPGQPDRASLPGPGGDQDQDGLPDVWEFRVGLVVGDAPMDTGSADRDGDGVSNAGEFLAGTDPISSASVMALRADVGVDGVVRLAWNRIPGRAVRVLVRDDLWGAERVLADVPARGTGGEESVTDTVSGGSRYYRLTAP
jgi:hypothetical protein